MEQQYEKKIFGTENVKTKGIPKQIQTKANKENTPLSSERYNSD